MDERDHDAQHKATVTIMEALECDAYSAQPLEAGAILVKVRRAGELRSMFRLDARGVLAR